MTRLAALILLVAPAFANPPPPPSGVTFSLTCSFCGSGDFVSGVCLRNGGNRTYGANTLIRWTRTSNGQSGVVALAAPLPPGGVVGFSGEVAGGLSPTEPCRATLVPRR